MYEYAPAPGIKISRIVNLADDLSMALKAISVRVVAPIPGKAAVGIEIPNAKRELVSVKTVLESEVFTLSVAPLTIALGKDITGLPVVTNLGRMPHLLIAGATGTGKSVCVNTILSSLLFRNTPEEMRLLLIDPKRIELSSFEGIPHLIHPVVTDAKMATRALRWAVEEMELRYKMLADLGVRLKANVRNIETYNRLLAREKPQKSKDPEKETASGGLSDPDIQHHRLPYVVIIIDELADLMMVASREVEESITRLAQMARAAGIHLILATQRPSVDVLTGIIKANIQTRISFQVSSKIDSRTILDGSGAEALLGAGDMLFVPPGTAKLQRIHGAFVSDAEILRLTEHWKAQKLLDDPLKGRVDLREDGTAAEIAEEELDDKYEEAVQIVLETRQASISMIQRRLRVGYNRAARMIEVMEHQGIVSPSDGIKPREVLGRRSL
jgi:S-DNA-T family DNA segregation ATPase FtsK/SpoIIIE